MEAEEKKVINIKMTRRDAVQLANTILHACNEDQEEEYRRLLYADDYQEINIRFVWWQ